MQNIRNFSIIARLDHGKSTLLNKLIQICSGSYEGEMEYPVLDSINIEGRRITAIKAQAVSLNYKAADGQDYVFNILDIPGHEDAYVCEGALVLVDATQGVDDQIETFYRTAMEQDLAVLPVLTNTDSPQAKPKRVIKEIEETIFVDAQHAIPVGASGEGVQGLLEAIVQYIPAPKGKAEARLRASIIDYWLDSQLGVIFLVRVLQGSLKVGEKMQVASTGKNFDVAKVGIFTPKKHETGILRVGEVGYVVANREDIDINVIPIDDMLVHVKPKSWILRTLKAAFAP